MKYIKRNENTPSWLDRAIEYINPKAAYDRLAWKMAVRGIYDSADTGRFGIKSGVANQNSEMLNGSQRDIIRYNAQQLERNSDLLQSVLKAFKRNVVGTGFKLQMKIRNNDGSYDEKKNTIFESLYKEWEFPENCDLAGRLSFPAMCRMAIDRYMVDGGTFFIRCETPGGLIPFKLQMREVSELDNTFTNTQLQNGNLIVSGIEVDRNNKIVAYHFKKQTANGLYSTENEVIPADRVIFWAYRKRPTDIREISTLTPMLARINATEKYMEAATMKARIAACSAMVITTNTPLGALGKGIYGTSTDETSEYAGQTMTPGMIYNLKNGESATSVQPAQDGIQVQQFMALNQRLIGSSAGLSYEATARDMSQTNYSSARQGRIEDGAEYDMIADDFKKVVLKQILSWFAEDSVLMGLVPDLLYSTFIKMPYLFKRHDFVSPARPAIDMYKEAKATEIIINEMQPTDTMANICQSQGLDWREVVEQRTVEAKYIQDLRTKAGLPMVNTVTGGPFDVNATNQG